jgi:4-hydroxythreonine-4-phosphate dehydrogenase
MQLWSTKLMVKKNKPIAVTMGDPSGVGPDITIQTWLRRKQLGVPDFVYVGSEELLIKRAKKLGLKINTALINSINDVAETFKESIPVLNIKTKEVEPGVPLNSSYRPTIESINISTELALNNEVSSICTNPVNKKFLSNNGFKFPGQTEYLSYLCKDLFQPVMMLASDKLKVIPLTRHVPLNKISKMITKKLIIDTISIARNDLVKYFNIKNPRIYVSGLNPHSGDGGLIGMEEIEIIIPAIKQLKESGVLIKGPLSADSMFHGDIIKNYDLAICMYHDQALIPIKSISFYDAVNVTLGLPLFRTSPDHGTAYELAGTGRTEYRSFYESLLLAHNSTENCRL